MCVYGGSFLHPGRLLKSASCIRILYRGGKEDSYKTDRLPTWALSSLKQRCRSSLPKTWDLLLLRSVFIYVLKNDFYSFEVCLSSWSFNFSIFPQSGLEAGPNYNLAGLKSMQFFELNNHTGKKTRVRWHQAGRDPLELTKSVTQTKRRYRQF